MGIPLRIVDRPEANGRIGHTHPSLPIAPGDMWHEPELDGEHGECWAVVLPNGRVWRTTDPASDPPHELWDVSGEPPDITVSPSINDTSPRGGWHGWIRDGVLDPA